MTVKTRRDSEQGIGLRIRELREERGITQEELALMLEVGQSAVSHWERGKVVPARKYLPKLAQALGVTIKELRRKEET